MKNWMNIITQRRRVTVPVPLLVAGLVEGAGSVLMWKPENGLDGEAPR